MIMKLLILITDSRMHIMTLTDCMFEGGPPEPKGMPCHLVIEYCSLLIMGTSGHGLMGVFDRKSGLGLCSCPLRLFWILTLNLDPMGSLLLTFGI